MWEFHEFETIFTSNDVMNIQYAIGKLFGSRERSYSMEVNVYFVPIITNRLHETSNYGPGKSRFEVDYYRQIYFSREKLARI